MNSDLLILKFFGSIQDFGAFLFIFRIFKSVLNVDFIAQLFSTQNLIEFAFDLIQECQLFICKTQVRVTV